MGEAGEDLAFDDAIDAVCHHKHDAHVDPNDATRQGRPSERWPVLVELAYLLPLGRTEVSPSTTAPGGECQANLRPGKPRPMRLGIPSAFPPAAPLS